jgi:hypothetical protein
VFGKISGFSGGKASTTRLHVPDHLRSPDGRSKWGTFSMSCPFTLHQTFLVPPVKCLAPGVAFLGTGNDSFGDSWLSFSSTEKCPVCCVVQSKLSKGLNASVSDADIDEEYDKVWCIWCFEVSLRLLQVNGIPFFFIFITDHSGLSLTKKWQDSLIVTSQNMCAFCGTWLAKRRTLSHRTWK